MTFPDISPIAFAIGPLVVRWYALAYVVGIVLAQLYIGWLNRRLPTPILTDKAREDLVLYGVLGIILGGRLGYVLFYNAGYYLHNPMDILMVWHGGMSFHGGFLGVLLAFYFFARRYQIRWLQLMDLLAAATPIGLGLGRLANFVNGELYGRVTSAPWGMVFPHGGDAPRHPSQLYEAGLEGLLLGLLLLLLATRTRALSYRGLLGGVFVGGYGLARFTVEFFREPDSQLGTFAYGISMGQLLCIPMMLVGIWLVVSAKKRPVV
ncbi:MAG: prolipoprotein diacylglyceryl transferase [Pseudomonadota bacterium]